jgi:hypothetical protein
VEAVKTTGEAFAATWRNQVGEIVGSTFGGTMCWMPLKPWSLRISREDDLLIVPCGECPGCLEFYRRRLADRLKCKYASSKGAVLPSRAGVVNPPRGAASDSPRPLWFVRIYAPIEQHAALSRKLHRRRGVELEPGFIRLGATSFAVLSHVKRLPPLALDGVALETRIEAIRLSRGRRAWRSATSGMLVAREAYGDDLNRFYLRGLPPAEKESWDVHTQSGAKGYSRASSPRVWKAGNLILVPPEVWQLGRSDRRTIRRDLGAALSPEAVARVMGKVRELVARGSQSSLTGPAGRPVLSNDGNPMSIGQVLSGRVCTHGKCPADRCLYAARKSDHDIERVSAPPSISPSPPSSSPPSEGGGYVSSIHSGDEGPPEKHAPVNTGPWVPVLLPPLPEDSMTDLTPKQRKARRLRKDMDAMLVRMQERSKGRT